MIALKSLKDKAVVDDVGIFFLLFDRFHAVVTLKEEIKKKDNESRAEDVYEKTNNCVFSPMAEYFVQEHTERRAPGMP